MKCYDLFFFLLFIFLFLFFFMVMEDFMRMNQTPEFTNIQESSALFTPLFGHNFLACNVLCGSWDVPQEKTLCCGQFPLYDLHTNCSMKRLNRFTSWKFCFCHSVWFPQLIKIPVSIAQTSYFNG